MEAPCRGASMAVFLETGGWSTAEPGLPEGPLPDRPAGGEEGAAGGRFRTIIARLAIHSRLDFGGPCGITTSQCLPDVPVRLDAAYHLFRRVVGRHPRGFAPCRRVVSTAARAVVLSPQIRSAAHHGEQSDESGHCHVAFSLVGTIEKPPACGINPKEERNWPRKLRQVAISMPTIAVQM